MPASQADDVAAPKYSAVSMGALSCNLSSSSGGSIADACRHDGLRDKIITACITGLCVDGKESADRMDEAGAPERKTVDLG